MFAQAALDLSRYRHFGERKRECRYVTQHTCDSEHDDVAGRGRGRDLALVTPGVPNKEETYLTQV